MTFVQWIVTHGFYAWLELCVAHFTFKIVQNKHSHILDHNILVWHQAIDSIVPSLPPVFWRPLIQQQRCALLEGQLSGWAADVVKLGDGFNGLALCQRRWSCRSGESGGAKISATDDCNHSWRMQTDLNIHSVCVHYLYVWQRVIVPCPDLFRYFSCGQY